jgi:hypothetical protein
MVEEDELTKRLQAGLRTGRAELSGLNARIGLLEHRLNTMDVRISELPISIEELKTHIDFASTCWKYCCANIRSSDEDHHRRHLSKGQLNSRWRWRWSV